MLQVDIFILLFPFIVAFDLSQPRTYRSSCNFQAGDEGHVYGENVFSANTFTTSQLISIRLDELMTSFNVSTDCHSQVVDLMNTLIRDCDKLKEGMINPKLLDAPNKTNQ
ncbi:hypothetical protein [Phocaeicola paurosaccharolyticus]|uniref:hypothetical protein n=1 Tax=Phocaeicola paurosaccharolyticus TaxID=732242 RepID=UPI002FE3EF3C